MDEQLELWVDGESGSDRNANPLVQKYRWSGGIRQVARTLTFSVVVSDLDKTLPAVDFPPGRHVRFLRKGQLLFDGFVLSRQRDTLSHMVEVSCADRGIYLKRNKAAYLFQSQTPEAITGRIARDFGISAGSIAQTGRAITRNFPGAGLYQIIQTAYTLAAEETGKRYFTRFRGAALEVVAKEPTASTLVIRPGSNLITLTATDSIETLINRVQILGSDGTAQGNPVEDTESIALYGLFQTTLNQAKNEDSAKQAKKVLEDNALTQKITAEVLGNPELMAGSCAVLQEPVTGLYGLCWIDEDNHTWDADGKYTAKLVLNFQNIMDEQEAGRLPSA